MRKLLILVLLLALQNSVKGQAGYELFYWLNNETESRSAIPLEAGGYSINVSHIPVGVHTLHLQIKDTAGVLGSPVSKEFFRMPLKELETDITYWFDGNYEKRKSEKTTGSIFKKDIDVSEINIGLHTLYIQAVYEDMSSTPLVHNFYRAPIGSQETTYTFWFDEDISTAQKGLLGDDIIWLDVTGLNDGFHTLYIQAEQHIATPAIAHNFLKVPQTDGVEGLTCLIFIDNELFYKEKVESNGGILNLDLDVSSLTQGVHTLQAYVVSPTGASTQLSNNFFIRSTTDSELADLKCYYTIDGIETDTKSGIYNNGAYHFDIDVASLEDGLHQLNYMLVGSNGVSTEARSSFFVKTPVGGNGIMQYEYWLNDNDSVKTVKKLEERTDPLKLITLLPVESVPIRSSQFHFEAKDDKPMIYAKNTLNMRFYDISARQTNLSREYIDYNVSQEVTDITPIARDEKSKTFEAPGENEIRWFSFEAQMGDSIILRCDKTSTIEVLSSTGEVLYTVNGAESIKNNGRHIKSDGTYYIAVHDVTASNVDKLTLDLQLIDKYAVLSYTPDRVGVTPHSFIMGLAGNGYDKLVDAELHLGNDKLSADTLFNEGTNAAELIFTLENKNYSYGKYNLVLYFNDNGNISTLTVNDAITFEEAVYGEIIVSINESNSTSNPYKVTVNIHNTGNVAYSLIPLNIAYQTNSAHNSSIRFENFTYSISKELIDNGFKTVYHSYNLYGKNCSGNVYPMIIPHLRPFENIDLRLSFDLKSNISFNLYAMTGRPWSTLSENTETGYLKVNKARPSTLPGTTCMPDFCDMIEDITEDLEGCGCSLAMGLITTIPNIYAALHNKREKELYDVYGADFEALGIEWPYRRIKLHDPMDILRDSFGPCLGAMDELLSAWEEYQNENNSNNDCEPYPSEPIQRQVPVDPNDIVGFTAESGSKYVPSDFENTFYTIRCENDPEFATASAHTVVVCDTLDVSKLDLSTFAARSVKIGDKVMELNGEKSFVRTMDLRPEIDVIAEVTLDYNEQSGIAQWTIKSLDPMTMEPTDDPMQGVLPINYSGNGEAEFCFDIELKPGLAHGEEIDNIASIVFDSENAICTPVWTNIIDNVKPVSAIKSIEETSDSTIIVNWEGSDEGSGIYRYQLYVQAGEDEEWKPLLSDTLKTSCKLRYSRDINFGFCVLATDSAGNVENKELTREFEFCRSYIPGDADKSGSVDILDINATLNHILGNETTGFDMLQMDSNSDGEIDLLDINTTLDIILNGNAAGSNYRRRTNVIRIMNRPTL